MLQSLSVMLIFQLVYLNLNYDNFYFYFLGIFFIENLNLVID